MVLYNVDLTAKYGQQAVKHLASAYEAVLLSVSIGRLNSMPDRMVREAIMQAMLTEGEASQFSTEKMRQAGAAVVAMEPIWSHLRGGDPYWLGGSQSQSPG